MAVGLSLKALRVRRSISLREVERASERIAAAAGDVRFRISNGWLVQLEKGSSEPGICKLFSLSVIYQVHVVELMKLYDIDVDRISDLESIATPQQTRLLTELEPLSVNRPASHSTLLPAEDCRFLRVNGTPDANRLVCGYIGSADLTMYPLIRPGSYVQIDTRRNKPIPNRSKSEYERPIYFVELRTGFLCGWCELDGKDLLVIPHPASPEKVKRFAFEKDAEIVGQVIAFYTRWLD